MAYTADINIVVKGQAAVNALQKSLTQVGEKIDELAKKRLGLSPTLETFNKQLAEAKSRLNEVVAGTTNETAAIKNYVTALGNANAATERQNKLIQNEIDLREAATKNIKEFADVQAYLYEKQRQLENSKLDEKAARVRAELDKQAAAAAESAAQIEKLNQRQAEFTARTDEAARAAARQTAEFIRQQRIAKEVAKVNANAPAPQLLLAPAAPGAPAMGGGARARITGPVERLGGARTQDQADTALRFAQALKEQVRPLSQLQSLYAGIAVEAAKMQRVKALPDAAMLNAAGRGIKTLETAQDLYNRELAETATRLQSLDRLEAARLRRAEKLRQIQSYYGQTAGTAGPVAAAPARATGGGARSSGVGSRLENIALGVGFPLLFGGGAGEVLGSLAGSFVGTGFGGQIFGGAMGGILDDFITKAGELGAALNPATADIEKLAQALGGTTTAAGAYITKLEELERSQEALTVATAELEALVGKQGVQALKTFSEDSTKLGSVFTQAMTQMQASVVSLINSTGILKALAEGIEYNVLLRQALSSEDPKQQETRRQREVAGGPMLAGGDPKKFYELNDKLVAQQRLINEEKRKQLETQTKILTQEEKNQEILKVTKQLAQELKNTYTEISNEVQKRTAAEQAAVDRGLAVSNARYDAEKATADLENTRLERAYAFAKTQQERYAIALALFENAVQTAKIEYAQDLEAIAAAERKLVLELEGLRIAEDKIKLKAKETELIALQEKDEQTRNARLQQIKQTTSEYLGINADVISEVEKQLAAQQQIGEYQKQTAAAQYENKILAAQTALEQKLVSDEIGLSNTQALMLSENLALATQETYNTKSGAEQLVGVIEVGTEKTYIMAEAMNDVATAAYNAAVQIQRAIDAQARLNASKSSSGSLSTAANGAYWPGGFTAFAEGGVVTSPTYGLVGEGGEPEYIIPASKMSEAMGRYASGARGSSVIPDASNSTTSSYSAGTSSINPVVNVTTGPVMNMNNSNYVSQADFLAGLQAASRQGAQMALATLQNNSSTRRAVGVR